MTPSDQWLYRFRRKRGWVFVPTQATIEYGQEVKLLIEKHWTAPRYYYHLQQGGHVLALQQHRAHTFFLHLDIKSFFGNIKSSRVTRSLKGMLSYAVAREIAIHSTVRHPYERDLTILPFGFIQSPIIASVCLSMSTLGKALHKLHRFPGMAVSVYMDDIILSSDHIDDLKSAMEIIEKASVRSNFPLNKKKQEGPGRTITAFNIELSQDTLDITPKRLSEFQEIYHHSLNPNQQAGILNYVKKVNAKQAATF
ncbi:hypothetical protein FE236_00590 [Mariprofundus erugo]|uniref:reverse transcriptase domain-containing protein n=1 Tax=Mariprofundus erugo TaxID=2528639 RepID=UPI0010FEDDE4|nr:reverse transcriptase domain-containing protein [Mariprofundus erugo]TLS78292.1 hypothetical protein FE236_00590 [Mariprofundus erugo]